MIDNEKMEEGLKKMFWGLFAHLRALLKGDFDFAAIHALAKKALGSMGFAPDRITWEAAEPLRIRDARVVANLNKPLRVVGTFAEIDYPELVTVPVSFGNKTSATEDVEAVSGRVVDGTGESIETLDVVGGDLVRHLHDLHRQGCPIEFLCSPVAVPTSPTGERKAFRLHVVDARRSDSALDFLGASGMERSETKALLERLDNPRDFIVDQLISNLRIRGLESFHLLRELMEFTVLQSVSVGRIDHAPARLHLLLIGPPGQGKKLVALAARALNPISVEISHSKVTASGLIGASHHGPSGWKSTPGALPRAAGGVAILQDAHAWSEATVSRIGPILQQVIEDGQVSDTVAGGLVREVSVALTIDLNRTAHLTRIGLPVGREAPILRLRPLLSRVDVVAEIRPDVLRAWEVSSSMYETIQGGTSRLESQPWVRQLKLLVALLRDSHPEVDLGHVREMMKVAHDQIGDENEHLFASMPEAGDIPARLVISFARLVTALARSRNSAVARPEDVESALKFIGMKLNFFKLQGPTGLPDPAITAKHTEWVASYAGREVRTADLVTLYQQQTGASVSERTIRRALQKLGATHAGKGVYRLPPPSKPEE